MAAEWLAIGHIAQMYLNHRLRYGGNCIGYGYGCMGVAAGIEYHGVRPGGLGAITGFLQAVDDAAFVV